MSGAVSAPLLDGRLHLQHGPIDLVIEAFGVRDEVASAYTQATDRFGDILETLVREELGIDPKKLGGSAWAAAGATWPTWAASSSR